MLKLLTGLIAVATYGALMTAELANAQPRERSGPEIVKAKCAGCHESGAGGAPKIDDRAAWIPRVKNGVDATVRSAARGHGGMPARGGLADLTDGELRAAILYMFYPAAAGFSAGPAAPAADPGHRSVGGLDVYLGVTPSKSGYNVNISVRDAATKADLRDAFVEARVSNPLGGTTRKLAPTRANNATSYVGDFRMSGKDPYTIAVKIQPKGAQPVETSFDFRP